MQAARTVSFSGRSWMVKTSTEPVGPGPNRFSASPDNARVDRVGQLHLQITHRAGSWLASEVILDASLGYGRYRFTIASAVGRFDPVVVLGLFTYGEDAAANHREIDIEFGTWADSPEANGRYTVQPGSGHAFVQSQTAASTHEFNWRPGEVSFVSRRADGRPVRTWTHRGADVPTPGQERARMNLWLQGCRAPTDGHEVHVVLSEFSFL